MGIIVIGSGGVRCRNCSLSPVHCSKLLLRGEGRMNDLRATELDLHAFIDGRLAAERRCEVAAYLDAHPDAAERVAAYVHQRDALGLLGRRLTSEPVPPRLAGLEAA